MLLKEMKNLESKSVEEVNCKLDAVPEDINELQFVTMVADTRTTHYSGKSFHQTVAESQLVN